MKVLLRNFLILPAFIFCCNDTYAGTHELAEELLSESIKIGTLKESFIASAKTKHDIALKKLDENKTLTNEERRTLQGDREAFVQAVEVVLDKRLPSYKEKLTKAGASVYAKNFTEEELQQCLAYEKTPLRQKENALLHQLVCNEARESQILADEFEKEFNTNTRNDGISAASINAGIRFQITLLEACLRFSKASISKEGKEAKPKKEELSLERENKPAAMAPIPANASTYQLAKELSSIVSPITSTQEAFMEGAKSGKEITLKKLGAHEPTEEERKKLDRIQEEVTQAAQEFSKEKLQSYHNKLVEFFVLLYGENFTEDELKQLIEDAKLPIFQKVRKFRQQFINIENLETQMFSMEIGDAGNTERIGNGNKEANRFLIAFLKSGFIDEKEEAISRKAEILKNEKAVSNSNSGPMEVETNVSGPRPSSGKEEI